MAFKFDFKKMVVCLNNLEQTSRTYTLLGFVKESSLSDSSVQKELELSAVVLVVEMCVTKSLVFLRAEAWPQTEGFGFRGQL